MSCTELSKHFIVHFLVFLRVLDKLCIFTYLMDVILLKFHLTLMIGTRIIQGLMIYSIKTKFLSITYDDIATDGGRQRAVNALDVL